VKNRIEIIPVKWIDQVLQVALERQPSPLPDEDPNAVTPAKTTTAETAVVVAGEHIKH